MVFNMNERVSKFFVNWRELFYKHFDKWPYEQPTFRTALWQSDVSVYILPPEYNIRSRVNREKQRKLHHEFGEDHLKPRIYHMHADKINQNQYDVKDVDEVLEFCKNNFMEY